MVLFFHSTTGSGVLFVCEFRQASQKHRHSALFAIPYLYQELKMARKKQRYTTYSIEAAVKETVSFLTTHAWAGPLRHPIDIRSELDSQVAMYLLDTYICLGTAEAHFNGGNVQQAKKDIEFSHMWRGEAYDMAFYNKALNKFTNALFDKTEDLLDDAVEVIFTGECPARKDDWVGFCDFKRTLEDRPMC
jgi:hypothetical protein